MRIILIGGIMLLAAGLAYSGHSMNAQAPQSTIISGKVTSIYGSDNDIIAIDGYNGHVVLAGFIGENSDMSPADGRKALEEMIDDKPVTCRHQNYDEYGRMVADCQNAKGRELTARKALGNIATR